jgi:hypothetical protein
MGAVRAARRFLSLGRSDQLLLIRAFCALALVDLRCRLRGFQRVIDSLPVAGPRQGPTPDDLRRAQRYAMWLGVAGRYHPIRARCLHQSLVLHDWLIAEGLPAELRIGVRTADRAFLAHAWVELGGEVVSDLPSGVSEFTPLARVAAGGGRWP